MSTAFHDIRQGHRVEDIALGSGFASASGFRAAYGKTFGAAPGRDEREPIRLAWLDSPLGPLVAAASDQGLLLLEFTERRMLDKQFDALRRHFGTVIVPGEHRYLQQVREELDEYFAGSRRDFSVPLVYPGSAFQREVWQALLEIPYGETWSYEALAQRVGRAGACRAVGTTNGLNRLAIVIPCHRVVNKSGKLGGYGGGMWRKQRLLELEGSPAAGLFS